MGLFSGTATYRTFQVVDSLPSGFHDKLIAGLQRYAFRDIDPKTNPEQSVGWVNPFDPFDADLTLEKVLVGPSIVLGLRWDRKSVPALLLKAKVAERIRAKLAERRSRKLGREEMAQIRESVKEALLATATPATTVYDVVWNLDTATVYLSTHANKVVDYFLDLFEETTGLEIVERTLVSRLEHFADQQGLDLDIGGLDETSFGSG